MLHISRLTLAAIPRLHKYWLFYLLALVGLVAETVLVAAPRRTLG